MGARPTSFKRGGGFLDGVDSTLIDYIFTDEFNGEAFKPGKIKGTDGKLMDRPHNLYAFVSFQIDGAEEPTTVTLKAGTWDDWNISEDGKTIWDSQYDTVEEAEENDDKAKQLAQGTAFAKFVSSFVEAGFPIGNLPEHRLNFEALIGARIRTVQRKDDERTKKFGQKKAKDGKLYDRKDLVVDQVYSYGTPVGDAPVATAPTTKTAKPAPATAPAKSKGKSTPPATPAFDLDTETTATLNQILEGATNGTVKKNQLSMAVLKVRMQDPNREAIRKRIFDDAFLKTEDGWTYDQAKGTVSLVTEEDQDEE